MEKKENWPLSKRLEIEPHKRPKLIGTGGIHLKRLFVETGVQVRDKTKFVKTNRKKNNFLFSFFANLRISKGIADRRQCVRDIRTESGGNGRGGREDKRVSERGTCTRFRIWRYLQGDDRRDT